MVLCRTATLTLPKRHCEEEEEVSWDTTPYGMTGVQPRVKSLRSSYTGLYPQKVVVVVKGDCSAHRTAMREVLIEVGGM